MSIEYTAFILDGGKVISKHVVESDFKLKPGYTVKVDNKNYTVKTVMNSKKARWIQIERV